MKRKKRNAKHKRIKKKTALKLAKNCKKKIRYGSIEEAFNALKKCWRLGREESGFYRCKICRGYHLTSNSNQIVYAKDY